MEFLEARLDPSNEMKIRGVFDRIEPPCVQKHQMLVLLSAGRSVAVLCARRFPEEQMIQSGWFA